MSPAAVETSVSATAGAGDFQGLFALAGCREGLDDLFVGLLEGGLAGLALVVEAVEPAFRLGLELLAVLAGRQGGAVLIQ